MRLKECCGSCGAEIEDSVEVEVVAAPELDELMPPTPQEIISAYIGFVRAYHLWMHGAHNVTKGPGFAGDHVELYGKIYTEVQDSIDAVIEKGVGVYQDEGIACPMKITADATLILDNWESPVQQAAERIADLALVYTTQLVKIGEGTAALLDEMGVLSYGMDNMLGGLVDTHENYVYLLQQRVK